MDRCSTMESGLQAPFDALGAELRASIERPIAGIIAPGTVEEMIAVLAGEVTLTCPDETHHMVGGDGILIPQGLAWRLEPGAGAVIYRVVPR